ncbi:MAG: hypothetical protein DDT36_00618 [Firmicutes bacterium]|nr:hypothetical protein [Bacillota bacterium]
MDLLGLAFSFVAIIFLVQRKVHLYLALLIGAVLVGLTSGQGLLRLIQISASALVEPAAIDLMLALGLISLLGAVMQELGLLARMVELLQIVLRSTKLTIMLVPSIIGSLLVTGGAILSAPTVRELGAELELPPERLSAINLLFRHGWYFVYPLMPAFVLITSITGVKISTLIAWQLPLAVAVLVAGYYSYLHKVPDHIPTARRATRRDIYELLKFTSPMWVSLTLTVALDIPLPVALLVGLVLALYLGGVPLDGISRLLYRSLNFPIIASGASIMIFKAVTVQVASLPPLIEQLLRTGLPPQALFIILPLLVGFFSSSNTSAIALTMPLLFPIMVATDLVVFGTVAAYSSSLVGYFASPLHLCQVVTLAHFECKIMPLYREYKWPLVAVLIAMAGISLAM